METTLSARRPTASGRSKKRKSLFAFLALLVLAGIVVLTQLPESVKAMLHTRGRFHAAGHVLVFAVLAFFAGRTQRSWSTRLLLFLGLVFFGFLTEVAEYHSIAVEWKDVLGDTVGVALGYAGALLTARRRRVRSAWHFV